MLTENNSLVTAAMAAAAFGFSSHPGIQPIGEGLINDTFLVEAAGHQPLLLQRINTGVFSRPLDLQLNYEGVSTYLNERGYFLPALLKTNEGALLWHSADNEVWRAFEFVSNSYSPGQSQSAADAAEVARCFGTFSAALKDFPTEKLNIILPGFHNLQWRYQQFQQALRNPSVALDGEAKATIEQIEKRNHLLNIFAGFQDEKRFPLHVMHHDCKMSNILFDQATRQMICPVDLDTVMPGKFYSDLGDIIRTTCASVDENSTAFEDIHLKEDHYECVVEAYREATINLFNEEEKQHFHYAGVLLVWMQALRFFTDYLNANTYYKVDYPAQNLHRAKNQLTLLARLEAYLFATGRMKKNYLAEK